MLNLTHQICIIGAGPVGLTLANCLSLSPYISKISLIDKKLPTILSKPYQVPNQRVYSINSPSLKILQSIGALKRIRQQGMLQRIQVLSRESKTFLQWEQKNARIVQNDQLVNALLSNLAQIDVDKKVQLIQGQITSFQNNNHSLCSVNIGKKQINTKLLVGSDGNKSKVKQLSNINTYGWNYSQKAIACTLEMQPLQSNKLAFQIYHDQNILGVLPLWNNYMSIVWSLQTHDFQHVMQLSDTQFVSSLNKLVVQANIHNHGKQNYLQLPRFTKLVNKKLSFPLGSYQSQHYAKHRIALIGDAAHHIHPMAGLGVNSGIVDAMFLANSIIENKRVGHDIGQEIALSGLSSKSKVFNYGNSLAMQAIKLSFQKQYTPLNWLRTQALNLIQQNQIIKSSIKKLVQQNPLVGQMKFQWQKK